MFDDGSINHLLIRNPSECQLLKIDRSNWVILSLPTHTSIDIPFLIYSHSHKKGHNPTVYSNPKNLPLSTTNEHNLKILKNGYKSCTH